MLTEAKPAITSWMLSVCLTSIALQSLLDCPWDIGHIFHWSVKDWQWVGKGSSEVATGRGKIAPALEIWVEKSHVFREREDVLFWDFYFFIYSFFALYRQIKCSQELWFEWNYQRWTIKKKMVNSLILTNTAVHRYCFTFLTILSVHKMGF